MPELLCIFEPVDDFPVWMYCPYCQRYQFGNDLDMLRTCDISIQSYKQHPKDRKLSPNQQPYSPSNKQIIPQRPTHGPGSELEGLFKELNIAEQIGCNCRAKAAQMDSWGVEGCRKHYGRIIKWLEFVAGKYNWTEQIIIAGKLLGKGLINVLDPTLTASCGLILDEAIRRAEEKQLRIIGTP